jgi:hypothetical protein
MFDEQTKQEETIQEQPKIRPVSELTYTELRSMVSLRANGVAPDKICALYAIDPDNWQEAMKSHRRLRATRIVTK